jgi:benzodiazapine receptor
MKSNNIIKLVISCGIPLAIGFGGSLFTVNSFDWYQSLRMPAFNPPGWIFMPVWTLLYLLMGVSVFLIWKRGFSDKPARAALACFIFQLILNAVWTPIFFGMKQPLIAFADIVLLWPAIAATVVCFYRISKTSAILLLPYIAWVSFAVVLNAAICVLNQ